MLYIIDTNVFLRVLVKEDEASFQASLQLLEGIKQKKYTAYIPGIVLPEIAWTLRSYYEFPKPQIVQAVQGILNLRGITIVDDYNYPLAIDLYEHHSVKYIDACIASLPAVQEKGAVIVSYDYDFDKLGIERREPDALTEYL
jgi:predicted nucleic-acid-binding protein